MTDIGRCLLVLNIWRVNTYLFLLTEGINENVTCTKFQQIIFMYITNIIEMFCSHHWLLVVWHHSISLSWTLWHGILLTGREKLPWSMSKAMRIILFFIIQYSLWLSWPLWRNLQCFCFTVSLSILSQSLGCNQNTVSLHLKHLRYNMLLST